MCQRLVRALVVVVFKTKEERARVPSLHPHSPVLVVYLVDKYARTIDILYILDDCND